MKTRNAKAVFNDCAELYAERFMDLETFYADYDLFCAALPGNPSKILELASGPGNITRYLLSKCPDLKVLATDIAPKMLEVLRQQIPEVNAMLLDVRELDTIKEQFDGIVCGFGAPYLSEVELEALICNVAQRLVKNGLFLLSTMEGDRGEARYIEPSSGTGPALFTHFHNEEQLRECFLQYGFEVVHFSRKRYPKSSTPSDLIFIVRLV